MRVQVIFSQTISTHLIKLMFLALTTLNGGCYAPFSTIKVSDGSEQGIRYYLPKAVLIVEANIKITEETQLPPLCKKMETWIEQESPTTNPDTTRENGEQKKTSDAKAQSNPNLTVSSLNISIETVPDPDEIYTIQLDDHEIDEVEMTFKLNQMGVLTSAFGQRQSQILPITEKVITTVADITGLLQPPETRGTCPNTEREIKKLNEYRREALDPNKQKSGIDIAKIINEINAREKELINSLNPRSTNTTTEGKVRCRFSAKKNDDQITITNLACDWSQGLEEYSKQINLSCETEATKMSQSLPKSSGEMAIFYRIPASARCKASFNGSTTVTTVLIPQVGFVAAISKQGLEGISSKVSLELDPDTGILRQLDISNSPVDPEQLKTLGTGIVELFGAIKNASKDQTEIEKLQEKKTVLELKRDVEELERELESTGEEKQ